MRDDMMILAFVLGVGDLLLLRWAWKERRARRREQRATGLIRRLLRTPIALPGSDHVGPAR